jgi:predicted nucleic acid-binding protein
MGMKGVFDTNILIDYLNGLHSAKTELEKYNTKIISIITWIEVLVGASNAEEEKEIKNFFDQFRLSYIDKEISQIAIELKRRKKIKLPDAVIWATAIKENATLITHNTKDFPSTEVSIRIPYLT